MTEPILKVRNLAKSFPLPDGSRLTILQDLSLSIEARTLEAITGVSGSGKSTFLHLVGSLDRPDSGEIRFQGEDILTLGRRKITEYRNRRIGFVFQFHYLMPELTVLENVAFPSLIRCFDRPQAMAQAEQLLREIGLAERLRFLPAQLSGGERQRVAIARSLINSPQLLLADEPTGNLDLKTGEGVFDLFRQMLAARGLTALIVTHNPAIAGRCDRCHLLQDGRLRDQ